MELARYSFQFGSFYFGTENNLRFMCQQVSLVYEGDTGTVVKHGPKDLIDQYLASKQVQEYEGIVGAKFQRITFDASAEAADWINGTLASSGSLLYRLKRLLDQAKPVN